MTGGVELEFIDVFGTGFGLAVVVIVTRENDLRAIRRERGRPLVVPGIQRLRKPFRRVGTLFIIVSQAFGYPNARVEANGGFVIIGRSLRVKIGTHFAGHTVGRTSTQGGGLIVHGFTVGIVAFFAGELAAVLHINQVEVPGSAATARRLDG